MQYRRMACAIHGSATCPEVPCPGAIYLPPDSPDNSFDESDAHAGDDPVIEVDASDVATFPEWETALDEVHTELRSDPAHAPHVDVLDSLVEKLREGVKARR